MVTHRYPMACAGQAIQLLHTADASTNLVKVVLDPWA
jgi:hypothetical protein